MCGYFSSNLHSLKYAFSASLYKNNKIFYQRTSWPNFPLHRDMWRLPSRSVFFSGVSFPSFLSLPPSVSLSAFYSLGRHQLDGTLGLEPALFVNSRPPASISKSAEGKQTGRAERAHALELGGPAFRPWPCHLLAV